MSDVESSRTHPDPAPVSFCNYVGGRRPWADGPNWLCSGPVRLAPFGDSFRFRPRPRLPNACQQQQKPPLHHISGTLKGHFATTHTRIAFGMGSLSPTSVRPSAVNRLQEGYRERRLLTCWGCSTPPTTDGLGVLARSSPLADVPCPGLTENTREAFCRMGSEDDFSDRCKV